MWSKVVLQKLVMATLPVLVAQRGKGRSCAKARSLLGGQWRKSCSLFEMEFCPIPDPNRVINSSFKGAIIKGKRYLALLSRKMHSRTLQKIQSAALHIQEWRSLPTRFRKFEFSPSQRIALGLPLFIGLRMIKKRRALKNSTREVQQTIRS